MLFTAFVGLRRRCASLKMKGIQAIPKIILGTNLGYSALIALTSGLFACWTVWESNLRRVRPESPSRPPRHRRDACSIAWCSFLTAPDALFDFHTGAGSATSRCSARARSWTTSFRSFHYGKTRTRSSTNGRGGTSATAALGPHYVCSLSSHSFSRRCVLDFPCRTVW